LTVVAVCQPTSGGDLVSTTKPTTLKVKTAATFIAPKLEKARAGDTTNTSLTIRWLVHPDVDDGIDGFKVECWEYAGRVKTEINLFEDGRNAEYLLDDQGKIIGIKITGLKPNTKYEFRIKGLKLEVESAALTAVATTLRA
jgi:hypothetical protein